MGVLPDGEPVRRLATQPRPIRQGMQVGEALRDPSFRWVVAAFWLTTITTIAVGLHLVPYLQDRGYEATFAATVTGLAGAVQVVARVIQAPFGERASPRILAASMLALTPVSLVVLLLVPTTAGVFAFVVLFGAARGASTLIRPTLLAHLYGRAQYASIAGVLQFSLAIAQALAPVGAGKAYDLVHSYEPIFWCLAGLAALSVVAVLPARQPRPKVLEALQSEP
jgi:MFS family permease